MPMYVLVECVIARALPAFGTGIRAVERRVLRQETRDRAPAERAARPAPRDLCYNLGARGLTSPAPCSAVVCALPKIRPKANGRRSMSVPFGR